MCQINSGDKCGISDCNRRIISEADKWKPEWSTEAHKWTSSRPSSASSNRSVEACRAGTTLASFHCRCEQNICVISGFLWVKHISHAQVCVENTTRRKRPSDADGLMEAWMLHTLLRLTPYNILYWQCQCFLDRTSLTHTHSLKIYYFCTLLGCIYGCFASVSAAVELRVSFRGFVGVCPTDLSWSLIGQLSVLHVLIIQIWNASHADKESGQMLGWETH